MSSQIYQLTRNNAQDNMSSFCDFYEAPPSPASAPLHAEDPRASSRILEKVLKQAPKSEVALFSKFKNILANR